jgi:hypothetical protein
VVRRGIGDPVEAGSAAGDFVDDLLGCSTVTGKATAAATIRPAQKHPRSTRVVADIPGGSPRNDDLGIDVSPSPW